MSLKSKHPIPTSPRLRTALALLVLLLTAAPVLAGPMCATKRPAEAPPVEAGKPLAPLLAGMGGHHFPISSDDPMTRRYFDQGLALAYGFNHAEAERSFREAARRDPSCAICWWGVAYVLGPNINAPMDPAVAPLAWEAITAARTLADGASDRERALIEALAARYAPEAPEDRAPLDLAYADAMREVARRFPTDVDAQVLAAEAIMDTMPWAYWLDDGTAKPETEELIVLLDAAVELEPMHPGANHFLIHTYERYHPHRALAAAASLEHAVPGAGHLVHMPSHIYLNVGLYHQATEANLRAVAADGEYLVQCHAQGIYPVAYASHNHHFLWAAATLEGRGEIALDAARAISTRLEEKYPEVLRAEGMSGSAQHFWVTPLFAMVRFGRWDDVLAFPRPDADLLHATGVWHYARGLAETRRGDLAAAAGHLAELDVTIADPGLSGLSFWDMNLLTDLLAVGRQILAGELAAARGDHEAAIRELEAGVAAEDALNYDDPPDWHHPVRQVLGAVLLDAGRPADAERVYREDLVKFPENGWSLHGLAESLAAQGDEEAATAARHRFDAAWHWADVELETSRF